MTMKTLYSRLIRGSAALALALASSAAFAWPCDFLTGGGFIIPNGAHANIDHASGLNVHGLDVTAYMEESSGTDDKGRLIGSRLICGVARTNFFGDVDYVVRAKDSGEPGTMDEFDIRLKKMGVTVYTTEGPGFPHKLNNGNGGGGNIQLHKPNPSTTGNFGGSCPALQ
jgi:hypothetical protein